MSERHKVVEQERPVSAGHSVAAGLVASVASTLVTHPFELVRARQQAKQLASLPPLLHSHASNRSGNKKRRPTLLAACVADLREMCAIVREEGVCGLYHGVGTHFVGHVASGIVFFAAQAYFQQRVDRLFAAAPASTAGRFARRVIASSLAGWTQVCATHPIWVVKNRKQLRRRDKAVRELQGGGLLARIVRAVLPKPRHSATAQKQTPGGTLQRWWRHSAAGMLVELARTEGVAGLYAGLLPSLVLTVHTAVQYAAYDELKSAIAVYAKRGRPLATLDRVAASIGAKGIAAVLGNPMTLLRTRLMQKNSPYRGVLDCVVRVVREEGVTTLFRGTSAALWKVLTAGIVMPCYDFAATKTRKFFA